MGQIKVSNKVPLLSFVTLEKQIVGSGKRIIIFKFLQEQRTHSKEGNLVNDSRFKVNRKAMIF